MESNPSNIGHRNPDIVSSSYKDNSGYVFLYEGEYYRAVSQAYEKEYAQLMQSGLYDSLVHKKLLIAHQETETIPLENDVVRILYPTQIPVISYAYEWSFSMLKEAALCTLNNALEGMKFGMMLKDANTFNIQFLNGAPILIDTLSFETYQDNESWIAYRQFCEHFIAPLVLMKYCNASLNKLMLAYPNGIPLEVCKSMLPLKARFNMHVYLHIFLQNRIASKPTHNNGNTKQYFSKQKLFTLLEGLKSFVSSLELKKAKTIWDNYYNETILSQGYLQDKKTIVNSYLELIPFQTLLDLGANDGEFSLLYKNTSKQIIALDEDRNCIEKLYRQCKQESVQNILPLICNLTNPSPDLGWNNDERPALFKRINADVTLSLALIHHLAIANNLPLEKIISFLHSLSPYLIIEFVEKEDPKVQQLLANRKDIFDSYNLQHFKTVIADFYDIQKETKITNTYRILFLLKRKG